MINKIYVTLSILALLAGLLAWPVIAAAEEAFHDEAELLRGRVVLTGTIEGSQVVAVDSLPIGEPDGTFDQVFILQQEEPAEILVEEWHDAEVLARPESLLVSPPEGEAEILLHLASADLDRGTLGESRRLKGRTVVTGYGLARHDGLYDLAGQAPGSLVSWRQMVTRVDRDVSNTSGALFQQSPEVSDSGGCQSGGTGSTSCSQSCAVGDSCATSCSSGFYACCSCHSTGATCQCKRDP